MNHQSQIRQLLAILPAKQQTLDFGDASLWQQLSEGDRQACCDAIATLLCQVTTKKSRDKNSTNKSSIQDER